MLSFSIDEKLLLGLGFSIFTEREYEIKTNNGKIIKVKAIKVFRTKNQFHFTCVDSKSIKYDVIVSIYTKMGIIKKSE